VVGGADLKGSGVYTELQAVLFAPGADGAQRTVVQPLTASGGKVVFH
jgi:hypothetical protein